MHNIKYLESKANDIELSDLNYLIGLDESGDQICEIDSSNSYCNNCIYEIVKEINEELTNIGYVDFYKKHDCNSHEVIHSVSSSVESSPEDDDFCCCENCGAEIDVGVLFTCTGELDHWLYTDIDLLKISAQDAHRLFTCITSADAEVRHKELVGKLIEKVNNLKSVI